ncbi:hypothetical protein PQX77_011721, partial [Marasmius sp. AFHP31]
MRAGSFQEKLNFVSPDFRFACEKLLENLAVEWQQPQGTSRNLCQALFRENGKKIADRSAQHLHRGIWSLRLLEIFACSDVPDSSSSNLLQKLNLNDIPRTRFFNLPPITGFHQLSTWPHLLNELQTAVESLDGKTSAPLPTRSSGVDDSVWHLELLLWQLKAMDEAAVQSHLGCVLENITAAAFFINYFKL